MQKKRYQEPLLDSAPLKSLLSGANVSVALLFLAVLASGIVVSYMGYEKRQLHNEHQKTLEQQNEAKREWGKLLLQQSSLTAPGRVERIADKQLDMEFPRTDRVEVVTP